MTKEYIPRIQPTCEKQKQLNHQRQAKSRGALDQSEGLRLMAILRDSGLISQRKLPAPATTSKAVHFLSLDLARIDSSRHPLKQRACHPPASREVQSTGVRQVHLAQLHCLHFCSPCLERQLQLELDISFLFHI